MISLIRPMAKSVWRGLTRPVGTVRVVSTSAEELVLTYDDGPDPVGTPAVLSSLAAFGATATFFVLVTRVRREKNLLREVLAAGHEVGLHGVDHQRLTQFPAREVLKRCRDGRAELEDLIEGPIRWFRAPYGALLPRHWAAVRRSGLMPVGWGPTPGDWRAEVTEAQMAAEAVADGARGAIVLSHDGFAGPGDGVDHGPGPQIDRGKLSTMMLSEFAERGLVGRSLGDALKAGRTRSWAWFRA